MPAEPFTFRAMLGGCARGDIKSWQLFAKTYGSLAEHLLAKRFGGSRESLRSFLPNFFAYLSENGSAFLGESSGLNEQEFAVFFQFRLFDYSRRCLGSIPPARIGLATIDQVFGKLPLAHQEPGWLALKGYSNEVIGKVLRVPLSLVKVGRVEVMKELSEFASPDEGSLMLTDSLLVEVERLGGQNCPEIKTFCKVMDGRLPWQDKRIVEQHISECRHCLERETSLKDTMFHLRTLPPLSDEETQSLLSLITLSKAATVSQNTILKKLMRVFH